MKKFILSSVLMIAFGAYVTYNYLTSASSAQQPVIVTTTATSAPSDTSASPTDTTATPAGSAPPVTTTASTPVATAPVKATPVKATPKGKYVDGTYTGSAADAYYGNIQVAATISGGKLTNVTFLQYPNDRSTSRYINQQAMPELKAEAIQAQSANVDGVSGASDSSAAFKQSLASALSQATA